MNTREIEILLNRYFDGESTLEEERILKEFFSSGSVPGHLKEFSGMFNYFKVEKNQTVNPDFEEKMLTGLTSDHQIPFYQNRRFWYYFTGIAASLLFIFTFLYESEISNNIGFGKHSKNQYSKQEKQLAYMQVKQTLGFVSGKMNRGFEPLQEMYKINATSIPFIKLGKLEKNLAQFSNNMDKIGRSVENIQKISKFTIIIKP
jgi:hypothetical protein